MDISIASWRSKIGCFNSGFKLTSQNISLSSQFFLHILIFCIQLTFEFFNLKKYKTITVKPKNFDHTVKGCNTLILCTLLGLYFFFKLTSKTISISSQFFLHILIFCVKLIFEALLFKKYKTCKLKPKNLAHIHNLYNNNKLLLIITIVI